jgi:3'(2'), 5'-bisphosphate nucleotidase
MPKPRFTSLASPRGIFLISLILLICTLAFNNLWKVVERSTLLSRHLHTPTTMSYAKELQIASLAVQRATLLTQKVFREKAKGTVSKDDKSPVTIGDFGAQALMIAAVKHAFPQDEIIGEEEASTLRSNKELSGQIWELVKNISLSDKASDSAIGGPLKDEEAMLEAIDAGKSQGGAKGRFWALDPIDGTKGFLRGGQYAVCLGLVVDGDIKVGVLGCPNLPVEDSAPLTAEVSDAQNSQRGVLFSAVLGEGATSRPLAEGGLEKGTSIHMKNPPLKDASFCESVESGHSSHGDNEAIASKLGITKPSVRMDSQSKYGSIARGAGDVYLRLPMSATYEEKVWDHAAGDIIVREAGGIVTDTLGKRLDFSIGRTLKANKGVVAATASLHSEVLDAVKSVLGAKGN